jgi:hypothetical protein
MSEKDAEAPADGAVSKEGSLQKMKTEADLLHNQDLQKMQQHLKKQMRHASPRGVINPRTSKWVAHWDATTFLALLCTAVVTPFEVALVQKSSMIWFVGNWVINSVFIVDMFLQFFMAYQEDASKGGMWITHRPKIVKHYLRGWFFIDILSIIPIDLIAQIFMGQDEDASKQLRVVRTIRLVRLIKLLRILRASRIIN